VWRSYWLWRIDLLCFGALVIIFSCFGRGGVGDFGSASRRVSSVTEASESAWKKEEKREESFSLQHIVPSNTYQRSSSPAESAIDADQQGILFGSVEGSSYSTVCSHEQLNRARPLRQVGAC
jgi:hypothetical protein